MLVGAKKMKYAADSTVSVDGVTLNLILSLSDIENGNISISKCVKFVSRISNGYNKYEACEPDLHYYPE